MDEYAKRELNHGYRVDGPHWVLCWYYEIRGRAIFFLKQGSVHSVCTPYLLCTSTVLADKLYPPEIYLEPTFLQGGCHFRISIHAMTMDSDGF